ncbi:MAG: phosphatidate cytidylyltransferase, partial [Lachnospiraceae bacterium]|nr:phosphatidate cytidylyltransferase [Lachnospiraceae bacterium]
TLLLYVINLFAADPQWYMMWAFAVVLMSLLYLFKIEERKLEDAMATITGVLYVVFFSFHVTLVEQTGEFGLLVWLIFLTAFGTDIMAYFSGYAFGKHKLCPKISPKKTIEGSIGGILGSVILCGLFGYIVMPRLLVHCLIIGILGGVVSQFGDLTASIFKRKMGIKDYGNLIPGHGGILDRFDSVLFTAPMVYYYISLVLVG